MNRFCVFPDANLSIESPNPIGRKTVLFDNQLFHSELLKRSRSDLRKRLRSGRAAGDIRIFETGSIRVLSKAGDFGWSIPDCLETAKYSPSDRFRTTLEPPDWLTVADRSGTMIAHSKRAISDSPPYGLDSVVHRFLSQWIAGFPPFF
jgi:hypothetical protein